jgi:hypothetical protein
MCVATTWTRGRGGRRAIPGLLLAVLLGAGPAAAQDDEPEVIVVYGRAEEQLGVATAGSEGRVGRADLELRPLARIGEVLETVPGLIATQHSGPGKANQLFLRGFNLDHGTDFTASWDGVPVNFRSHGHGQGYLDLNFVIPELIESLDFRKGPYRADVGDFGSAGAAFLRSFDRLPESIAELSVGQDDWLRGLVAGNVETPAGDVVLALEGIAYDDPYILDADLRHINAFAKLSRPLGDGTLRVSALGYHGDWKSTDQIPQRAIDSGLVPRLGFLDPDLGGSTTRVGLTVDWRDDADAPLALNSYLIYYDFELFSNFTYFLDDPVNGDEFAQYDERVVWGASGSKPFEASLLGAPINAVAGVTSRLDAILDVGLDDTVARQRLSTVRRDQVTQWSGAVFGEARWAPWTRLTVVAGLRGDLFVFDVDAQRGVGAEVNGGSRVDGLVNPKLALILRAHDDLELYANAGGGFHSNDARGTTIRIDPASGLPADRVDPLARQWGAELGARWQPDSRFHATVVGWWLRSESELVFVGDAGTTEPQGASERYGGELAAFWRPFHWIAFDAAYAVSRSGFLDLPSGANRIPGAIEEVVTAGATLTAGPWSGSMRVRHFGAYPLVEDDSERARPTTLVNLGVHYAWRSMLFGVEVLNLFESRDNDIEYFYASQLAGEPAPVDDVHLHPVAPRQVRATVAVRF